MLKKKALALLLAAATALTVFPPPVLADETTAQSETPSVLIYSEDFEGDSPEIHVFTTSTGGYEANDATYMADEKRFKVAQDAAGTGNSSNKYGSFYSGEYAKADNGEYFRRVGYQFSNEGIKTGKVRVKFKFRSNDGGMGYGIFLLGNNTTHWNWLACVGFDKGGSKPVKVLNDGTNLKLVDKYVDGTWYSYDATLDLDTESIDASLYDMSGNLVKNLKWTANGLLRNVSSNYTQLFWHWPNNYKTEAERQKGSPFSIKSFAAYTNLDVDDIEVYCDPIEATALKFLRNDGAEYSDDVSFLTARSGQITFNHSALSVDDDAVKIGDTVLKGTLSSDGYTYTFDIPIGFVGGKEYTVSVDQTKIKMRAVQAARNEGTNLNGVGTKEFKFTPSGVINYSENFDKGDVDVFDIDNNGKSTKVEDTEKYEQKTEEDGNKYGHFCNTVIDEKAITGSDTEKYYAVDWDRRAVNFDENGVTDGKLKIHFRFRPTEQTFEVKANVKTNAAGTKSGTLSSFGSVLIGNSDQLGANGVGHAGTTNAKGNWLPLINVKNGKLQTLSVDGSAAKMPLKDSSGNEAVVTQDTWYTCDAVLDLDANALDIKVVEDGTNKVFRASHSGLTTRESEWGDSKTYPAVWPTATQPCFKSFGVLAALDIDDIQISTDCSPSLTATTDKLTAKATVTTEKENKYMIIAQYDKHDRIAAVTEKKFTLEAAAAVYSQDVAWADGAVRAKAFIWDNLNDANPLEKFAEITKP